MNFTCLEKYIDISELESCHAEICYGLSKSEVNLSARLVPHLEMSDASLSEIIRFKSEEGSRVVEILKEAHEIFTKAELYYYRALNHEQKKRFLLFYKGAFCDGEYVRLRYPSRDFREFPESIFYSENCEWHPNSKYFKRTLQFIKKLPFIDLGRVLFFVTYQYIKSDIHYDRKNDCYDGRHHYLWINPFKRKRFFLLHSNGVKQYINSRICIFDGTILHGCEASDTHSYTLRIDGQLSQDFCQRANIAWRER
jgi:hypothetical protein